MQSDPIYTIVNLINVIYARDLLVRDLKKANRRLVCLADSSSLLTSSPLSCSCSRSCCSCCFCFSASSFFFFSSMRFNARRLASKSRGRLRRVTLPKRCSACAVSIAKSRYDDGRSSGAILNLSGMANGDGGRGCGVPPGRRGGTGPLRTGRVIFGRSHGSTKTRSEELSVPEEDWVSPRRRCAIFSRASTERCARKGWSDGNIL